MFSDTHFREHVIVFIDLLSKSELGVSSLKNRADRKNKKISRPSI